jgi:Gelsolin repeat
MCLLAGGIQLDSTASSLNSADCFVLLDGNTAYTWEGKLSTPEEKSAAIGVATALAPAAKKVTVQEGKEPDAFWDALGGKVSLSWKATDNHRDGVLSEAPPG